MIGRRGKVRIRVGNAIVAVGVNGSGFDCSKTPRKLFLSVKKRVRVRLKVRFPQPYFINYFYSTATQSLNVV